MWNWSSISLQATFRSVLFEQSFLTWYVSNFKCASQKYFQCRRKVNNNFGKIISASTFPKSITFQRQIWFQIFRAHLIPRPIQIRPPSRSCKPHTSLSIGLLYPIYILYAGTVIFNMFNSKSFSTSSEFIHGLCSLNTQWWWIIKKPQFA